MASARSGRKRGVRGSARDESRGVRKPTSEHREVGTPGGAEDRLAEADRLAWATALVCGLAHEINNPLTAVVTNIGFADNFIAKLPDRMQLPSVLPEEIAQTREALADAAAAAEQIRKLVEHLVLVSRSPAFDDRPLYMPDVVDAALATIDGALLADATFTREYGSTPLVRASEPGLVHVFTALVLDAVRSSAQDHGGAKKVRVSTSTDDAGRASIEISFPSVRSKNEEGRPRLAVIIAHDIVRRLGGEVAFVDDRPRGSAWRIVLPPAMGGDR